jgi:hypothetical protein
VIAAGDVRWIAEHVEDGVLRGRVGRAGDDLVAEWTGVARLDVRRDGTNVRFTPAPGASPEDVGKIRDGAARALLHQMGGALALHGSAVGVDGRAVVFFAGSGAGKSTLAAGLCERAGAELLSDDVVVLERGESGFEVLPLERCHWLDAASRAALGLGTSRALDHAGDRAPDKEPVPAKAGSPSRAKLAALVHLSFGSPDEPSAARVDGVEAAALLLAQLVRFVVDEPELQRRELDEVARLVEEIPLWRLERPRRMARLGDTVDLARALASGAPPEPSGPRALSHGRTDTRSG